MAVSNYIFDILLLIFLFVVNQKYTRQQTTTNDYCRLQTFNQRLFLDKLRYFAASNMKHDGILHFNYFRSKRTAVCRSP